MLSLRLNQSWLSKMLSLLALMIGTSVFVPTAQAFQEEEPAFVVDEESVEEVNAKDAEIAAEGSPDEEGPDEYYAINTIVMFICGVLVLFMQAGFAMLEAGLVRSKNVTMQLTKNISLFSFAGFFYYLVGYNLMYPGDGWSIDGWLGAFSTTSLDILIFCQSFISITLSQYFETAGKL